MFKSFYKVQHSAVFSNMGLHTDTLNFFNQKDGDIPNTHLSPKRESTNVLTTNLLVAFVTLFSLRYSNISKRTAHSSSIVNFNNNLSFIVSFFFLPKRRKGVIFLRAPYKNKLARLNILNLEYTFILSLRAYPRTNVSHINIPSLLSYFSKFNVSSTKLKHSKTIVSTSYSQISNFDIRSFAELI